MEREETVCSFNHLSIDRMPNFEVNMILKADSSNWTQIVVLRERDAIAEARS